MLAVSTLRGEREDNRVWSRDPSRPAIIVGTIDMIGSRLLFSGYGDGRSRRALHAGLLGCDALIINDEAHLTPAFASLLGKLANIQAESGSKKGLRLMRLSATHQRGHKCWPESLDEDRKQLEFRKAFEGRKRLEIVSASIRDSKLLELATASGPTRTLIFLRKPEEVREVAASLGRKTGQNPGRIICLTGTMRGFERDLTVCHPGFQKFAATRTPAESYWLIATSAAEVGVNISSDRLITDLDTADHLIQRFGRLNRFGETEGQAYLLVSDAEEKDAARKEDEQKFPRKCKTLAYLRELVESNNDITTSRLFACPPPAGACSELPVEAQLHDWLLDVWSQTSLGVHPALPAVEPWLHGKQTEYPETYLAWREDVRDLAADGIGDESRELLLAKYRVLAHERLREPTYQLQEKFRQLAEMCDPSTPVLCQRPDGSVAVLRVHDLAEKRQAAQLAYSQLVLPPGCGSLDRGMFSPACPDANDAIATLVTYDLAGCELEEALGEARYGSKRACYRGTFAESGWRLQRLGGVPPEKREPPVTLPDLQADTLREFATKRGWRLLFRLDSGTGEVEDRESTIVLLYFRARAKNPVGPSVLLKDHLSAVGEKASALVVRLGFSEEIARALVLAGQLHDLGKQEPIWQRAAGNSNGGAPVAKSTTPMRPSVLAGFRHELASLRHAEHQLDGEPAEVRDLTLHLIAAHHGHARPCFEKRAYDRQHRRESEHLALEAARRFGRLQQRYGAWGLAYLEAVFKSADALASTDAEEYA